MSLKYPACFSYQLKGKARVFSKFLPNPVLEKGWRLRTFSFTFVFSLWMCRRNGFHSADLGSVKLESICDMVSMPPGGLPNFTLLRNLPLDQLICFLPPKVPLTPLLWEVPNDLISRQLPVGLSFLWLRRGILASLQVGLIDRFG